MSELRQRTRIDVRTHPASTLRVLDLFSGTGSATQPFVDRGHDVFRVELDVQFDADMHADVRELTVNDFRSHMPYGELAPFDFIWASPPCTSFSVGSFRHHWQATDVCRTCARGILRVSGERWQHIGTHDPYRYQCPKPSPQGDMEYRPKSETGHLGHDLLVSTLSLIEDLNPRWWIIENPRALMRKMPELDGIERRTITHCQHADQRWKRAALEATRRLATHLDEFTTDEIWGVLDGLDVHTHEPRALGAVIRQASRKGWISKTGRVRQSERPECHARDVAVWKSNIRKDYP